MDIIRVAHQTNETWKVDTIMVDCQLWFKGKDLALILGYSDTKQAIQNHVRLHQKRKLEELMGVETTPMDYQTRTSIYITSGGLFRLMMRSRMPFAEDFQDWVTDEVLESIRRYGKYDPHGQTALLAPAPSILEQLRIIDDKITKSKTTCSTSQMKANSTRKLLITLEGSTLMQIFNRDSLVYKEGRQVGD